MESSRQLRARGVLPLEDLRRGMEAHDVETFAMPQSEALDLHTFARGWLGIKSKEEGREKWPRGLTVCRRYRIRLPLQYGVYLIFEILQAEHAAPRP